MKIQIYLDGFVEATETVIADVPDTITEAEIQSIREVLFMDELEAYGLLEVQNARLGDIVDASTEALVLVLRKEDGTLEVKDL